MSFRFIYQMFEAVYYTRCSVYYRKFESNFSQEKLIEIIYEGWDPLIDDFVKEACQ